MLMTISAPTQDIFYLNTINSKAIEDLEMLFANLVRFFIIIIIYLLLRMNNGFREVFHSAVLSETHNIYITIYIYYMNYKRNRREIAQVFYI